jgi:putative NADH-flavin reductase
MAFILIIGASRGIGLETVRGALAAGHRVRALARSAAGIPIAHERLEKIAGSALEPGDVARALAGSDAVILSLGATSARELLADTTLFSRATRVLVDAMTAAGPRRLVAVTGLGSGDSRGHGGLLYDKLFFPLVLKRIYDDKDVQEMIIRRSGLDWTIVRPGILTQGPATGAYHALTEPKDWRAGSISRADVADFLVREVETGAYRGRTPLLIG